MKIYHCFLFGVFFLLCAGTVRAAGGKVIRVLQFNIWQEGTSVPGGYDAIVDEIDRLQPDFVMFSEVRNYNNTRFCDRIVSSLASRNKTYYSFYSSDSGLLSLYPITDSLKVYPGEGEKGGTIHKLVTKVGNLEVCVYTAHLDYTNYAAYLPRGYDGFTWKKLPECVTDVKKVLENNLESKRDEALNVFLNEARKDTDKNRLVLLGGDFNEPSHLDWTEAVKDSFDHHGCVVPWTSTLMLENAGYLDSFRERFPDPQTHPGFTYPADCRQADVSKLAWAPDADDRDRIDYIFYYPNPQLHLIDCAVVGPKGSIVKNQRVEERSMDIIIEPRDLWPSDHKAVLATFYISGQ